MKRISSIILMILCIFSFNTCFQINSVQAEPTSVAQAVDNTILDTKNAEDILEKPVFEPETQQTKNTMLKGKLSSLIIKVFGGVLLFLVVIICLSFIWFANLQRKKEKRQRRMSADANVINAVDNFARHRIKR